MFLLCSYSFLIPVSIFYCTCVVIWYATFVLKVLLLHKMFLTVPPRACMLKRSLGVLLLQNKPLHSFPYKGHILTCTMFMQSYELDL